MYYKVRVSGVPTRVKLGKLVQMFSLIMSMPNSDFLVQLMPSKRPLRVLVISFRSYSEAFLAQEMLDNFVYRDKTIESVFKATMHKDHQKPTQKFNLCSPNRQPHVQDEGQQRDRSQSPHTPAASAELDMRIELLKKQKQILEEETKLLEEQKKLDRCKMRTFKNKTSSTDPTALDHKQSSTRNACGVLIKSLIPFISKYASLEEHNQLIQHMNDIFMERMAVLVAANDHGLYTTHRVINLYRRQYPPEEDEEFVKSALQDVKNNLTSPLTATASASPEGGDGNKVGAADDHNQEGQATAKDTTSPGDSNASENINNKATGNAVAKWEEKNSVIKSAIRVIMKKMRLYMIIHSSPDIRELLVEYVYFTIRQRVDSLAADVNKCQPSKIINLYGLLYPRTMDEEFIKQLIKDINEGRVPEEIIIKARQRKPFNKIPQEKLTIQGVNNSGQGIKENQDNPVIVINEDSVQSNAQQISESAMEIVSDVKNAKNVNDNMENSSVINDVSDEIEKGKDVSANTKIEDNVKNKDEIKLQSPLKIGSYAKDAERGNENMEYNSHNNEVSDETEKGKDVSANKKNEDNAENKEEMKLQSAMKIGSAAKNTERENENMENTSLINEASNETDKGKDASANTKNECNEEEMKLESTTEIGSNLKNAEKGNDNVLSDSSNIVSDENEMEKDNDNLNADGDSKIEFVVTETAQKCSDNMEVNEYNRGVKRKNDEEEINSVKEHKSEHIVVIDCENTIKD